MSPPSKFKSGRGRGRSLATTTYGNQASRLKHKCVVPACSFDARSDHLKEHYQNIVKFNPHGNPLCETDEQFITLTNQEKQHTLYFTRQGFTREKLPMVQGRAPVIASSNPSETARKQFQRKQQQENVSLNDTVPSPS